VIIYKSLPLERGLRKNKQRDKLEFTEVFQMDKSIRMELLGIGLILFGIALGTLNFLACTLGGIGFLVVAVGFFSKDKDE
jgi:hypothetical protein